MKANGLRLELERGEAALGCFVSFPSPALVELTGYAGFDFVVIDAEHGPLNVETAENMIRAADTVDVAPVARVPQNDPKVILRYLDAGAVGIQVPMIESREDAVRAVRHPPLGERGLAGVRAARYKVSAAYCEAANREVLLIVQIETRAGLENVEQIAAVDGVDLLFVGPTDLSASLGAPGASGSPEVEKGIARVLEAADRAGKPAGILARSPEGVREARERGFAYLPASAMSLILGGLGAFVAGARDSDPK